MRNDRRSKMENIQFHAIVERKRSSNTHRVHCSITGLKISLADKPNSIITSNQIKSNTRLTTKEINFTLYSIKIKKGTQTHSHTHSMFNAKRSEVKKAKRTNNDVNRKCLSHKYKYTRCHHSAVNLDYLFLLSQSDVCLKNHEQ